MSQPERIGRRRLALGAAALLGLHRRAEAQSRRLTVMCLGGTWGESIDTAIGTPFKVQTGATIAYDNRPNAQQVVALLAMRNRPTIDVAEIGGPTEGKTVAAGLIAPMDPGIVTNAADILPAYRTPLFAYRLIVPFALTFNTKFVSPEVAREKGWEILLDPRLKGKVAIPKFGWQGETWMNGLNLALGGSYDNFDPAIAFCRKIIRDNDGQVMESNDQGMTLFQSGEIVAAPFWTGRTYELQDKGVPVAFVYAKGWTTHGVAMGLIKGGPNPELAQKYVQISLDPEVQIALARRFSYLPTNRRAIEALKDQPRLQIPEADLATAAPLDFSRMVVNADRNLERFNREVTG